MWLSNTMRIMSIPNQNNILNTNRTGQLQETSWLIIRTKQSQIWRNSENAQWMLIGTDSSNLQWNLLKQYVAHGARCPHLMLKAANQILTFPLRTGSFSGRITGQRQDSQDLTSWSWEFKRLCHWVQQMCWQVMDHHHHHHSHCPFHYAKDQWMCNTVGLTVGGSGGALLCTLLNDGLMFGIQWKWVVWCWES